MGWRTLTEEEAATLPEARLGGALLWIVIAAFVLCLVALLGSTLAFQRLPAIGLRYAIAVGFVTIWSAGFLVLTALRWRHTPVVASAGLVLWIAKRRQKARPGAREAFSLSLVDGLNAGTVAGLFIAVAAFFWANRLLPHDLPGRQLWEVRAFFSAWGLSLVYAFLFQRRKWLDLLAVAAASLALVPVINALTTQRHLAVSLPAGDWVMAGFDLTCLAGALLLAWVARKAARARKAPAGRPAARPAPSPQSSPAA